MRLTGCKVTSFSDARGGWGDTLGYGAIAVAWLNWDTWLEGRAVLPAYPRWTPVEVWFQHEGAPHVYRGVVLDYGRGHVVGAGQVEPGKWFDLWLPASLQVLDLAGTVFVERG